MTYIIQNVVNYALLLSVHLLIILSLRKKVCDLFGAVTAYKLWLLPMLCLPFYFFDWSLLDFLAFNDDVVALGMFRPAVDFAANGVDVGRLNRALTTEGREQTFWPIVCMIWLAGVMVLFGMFAYRNWKFSQYLSRNFKEGKSQKITKMLKHHNFPDEIRVYFIHGINSPALYGLLRPVLLVPSNYFEAYDENQCHVMLAHEHIHYERRDNLWSSIASFFVILFWFNPLVYLAYPILRLDQELSCDSLTLSKCNTEQRKRYAASLVQSASMTVINDNHIVVSNWNNLKHIKARTIMLKTHLRHKNRTLAGGAVLLSILIFGNMLSYVFAGNSIQVTEAEIVPNKYFTLLSDQLQLKIESRETPRAPVPYDSDNIVFLIDSSGSMVNYSWDQAIYEIRQILNKHPNLNGFQIINDMGQYIVSEKRREWIEASDSDIESALAALRGFNGFSNSSPVEGFSEVFDYLVEPSTPTSIYVLSDELDTQTNPEELVALIDMKGSGVRIHTKMFPVYFSQPARYQLVARNFADAMFDIAERTEGSFEIIEMDYSFLNQ